MNFKTDRAGPLALALIALRETADQEAEITSGNAKRLMSLLLPILVEMRDNGEIELTPQAILGHLSFSNIKLLAARHDFPLEITDGLRSFLTKQGMYEDSAPEIRIKAFAEHFSYFQSYWKRELTDLEDCQC